jgi:hypothetical protein
MRALSVMRSIGIVSLTFVLSYAIFKGNIGKEGESTGRPHNEAFKNAACLVVVYNRTGGYGANPSECSCPLGFMLH